MKIIVALIVCLAFNGSALSQSKKIQTAPVIVRYQGLLESGITYRSLVRYDKNFGLLTIDPVQIPRHYAMHIEWTNLGSFPVLVKIRRQAEKRIVFRVVSHKSRQMTANRWNMTIRCKIIRVEQS